MMSLKKALQILLLLLLSNICAVDGIINGENVKNWENYGFIGALNRHRPLPFNPISSVGFLWCRLARLWNCDPLTNRHLASVVLIHPQWTITAAHVFLKKGQTKTEIQAKSYRVGFGSVNRLSHSLYPIEKIIIHPEFSRDKWGNYFNDIALLKLTTPLTDIPFIQLPDALNCTKPMSMPATTSLQVLGWGRTATAEKSATLQKANLTVLPFAKCLRRFAFKRAALKSTPKGRYGDWLCTYTPKTDSCAGDSGGPLFWNRISGLNGTTKSEPVLQALVSFGKGCATTRPAINVNVQCARQWIEQFVKLPNIQL